MYFSFDSNIMPHISFMNKCQTSAQWSHPRRTSSEYILFILISGEMYLQEDDFKYVLKKGDYIFLQPNHTHFGYRPSQCEYYYIHFQASCLHGWDCSEIPQIMQIISDNNKLAYQCDPFNGDFYQHYKLFLPKDRHIYSPTSFQQIILSLNEIINLEKKQTPHFKLMCSARFIETLIFLSTDFVAHTLPEYQNSPENTDKLHALLNYIHVNYADKITGDILEEQLHTNFDSLSRLFKQETGITIFLYLKQVRLNHARELLATTHLKLDEISSLTGFCDQYYFSKEFKREFGISPKEYANKVFNHTTE